IRRIQDARETELGRSQQLMSQMIELRKSEQPANEEILGQYRDSLSTLEALRSQLETCQQNYAKRISENLPSLHAGAVAELYPLAIAHQDIRSASDEEATWAAFKKHAAAIDDLKSRLERQGADHESLKFFDKLKNVIFMEFELHVETRKAAAKIEKIQSAL